MCMAMRGAQAPGATTVTTAVRGRFAEDPQVRAEFLRWIQPAAGAARAGDERIAIQVADAPCCVHAEGEGSV